MNWPGLAPTLGPGYLLVSGAVALRVMSHIVLSIPVHGGLHPLFDGSCGEPEIALCPGKVAYVGYRTAQRRRVTIERFLYNLTWNRGYLAYIAACHNSHEQQ